MKRKYRHHTLEYKQKIVQEIENNVRSLSAVCRQDSLAMTMVERWRQQVREGTLQDHPTARERHLEKELERYKKKVGELSMEIDLLKKIEDYSLRMRKSNGFVVTGQNVVSRKGVKS